MPSTRQGLKSLAHSSSRFQPTENSFFAGVGWFERSETQPDFILRQQIMFDAPLLLPTPFQADSSAAVSVLS